MAASVFWAAVKRKDKEMTKEEMKTLEKIVRDNFPSVFLVADLPKIQKKSSLLEGPRSMI